MNNQISMFDAIRSTDLKREGMALAADSNPTDLEVARQYARTHAFIHGTVTADDVGEYLSGLGIDLGPAAGSIFKGSEWEFTGERILSKRVKNHARELKVWAWKG